MTTLTFTATASDLDGDALTFSATNVPAGATINANGLFSWTPPISQTGAFILTIIVSSGSPQQSDSEDISITVSLAPSARTRL